VNGTNDPRGVAETVRLGAESATVYRPERLAGVDAASWARRPRTVRVLLESAVRHGASSAEDLAAIRSVANGAGKAPVELPFYPERVLLQDFTGVPVLVDLSTLRDAAADRGIPPERVNPVVPVDLIVDHSVQVDSYGSPRSLGINIEREYERNGERYQLLRWAKGAFRDLRVVPPGNGICHQVNLEHLASVVSLRAGPDGPVAFPDTVIGTDSHTTMVNGLSVLGFGVGGIEAEAVMLGEPYFLGRPEVVGVELRGRLAAGATATDVVLTVTKRLREVGVVDKFVEFCGDGVGSLSVPDRATVSNMCPEYGATAALFPIDERTVDYLRGTGREPAHVARVEAYARTAGLWGTPDPSAIEYDRRVTVDLAAIVPTVSGPRNPEEGVPLPEAPRSFRAALDAYRASHPRPANGASRHPYPSDDPLRPFDGSLGASAPGAAPPAPPSGPALDDGAVVIAAITSCTNTSNPSVMIGAGLIARKARELGLSVPRHVKTSLAPGSKVVTAYLERAGLLAPLAELGFGLVGYGCTTCIGNSGPLPPAVDAAVRERDLFVGAVLSGNRNFEARIHNEVRANYLASPMLVVAYALAGRLDVDLTAEPVGRRPDGTPVFLRELWPTPEEVAGLVASSLDASLFREKYRAIEVGDAHWDRLASVGGVRYPWSPTSTYVAKAPFLDLPTPWLPSHRLLVRGARALAALGDKVTTDHISPAGEIPEATPAGEYLRRRGVPPAEFNTYGSRRGHHEVLLRGTFANLRLKNELAAPREGGVTVHLPSGEAMTIFDAAERYRRENVPLVVLAGESYGQGSSRDWAAKGPRLLGVGAILARGFERIHRTNLIEMGVLPLTFLPGEGWKSLGLTGRESFEIALADRDDLAPRARVRVTATGGSPSPRTFDMSVDVHSATELAYYREGGILPYVVAHRFAAA
jgi:aconitate hydratase